jgi:DNA-binding IclR family transcriptional regulator
VFKVGQELVGALTISGPIVHFTKPRTAKKKSVLLEAAARLTRELGGNPERLNAIAAARASKAK